MISIHKSRLVVTASLMLALALSVRAANRYWVAKDAGKWADAGNWSATSQDPATLRVHGNGQHSLLLRTNTSEVHCGFDGDARCQPAGLGIWRLDFDWRADSCIKIRIDLPA